MDTVPIYLPIFLHCSVLGTRSPFRSLIMCIVLRLCTKDEKRSMKQQLITRRRHLFNYGYLLIYHRFLPDLHKCYHFHDLFTNILSPSIIWTMSLEQPI